MSDEELTDVERDRLAEAWLIARHGRDWYIGSATRTEWEMAYDAVDNGWRP